MNVRADAALIVGTDKSRNVNDPTAYEFNANIAADLQAGVFPRRTIDRWPDDFTADTVQSLHRRHRGRRATQGAGHLRDGLRSAPLRLVKDTLADFGLPVDDPQIPFTEASQADGALAAFQANADRRGPAGHQRRDRLSRSPRTPSSTACSAVPRRTRKRSCCLEGEEDRIIKAADYPLEREIANLINVA